MGNFAGLTTIAALVGEAEGESVMMLPFDDLARDEEQPRSSVETSGAIWNDFVASIKRQGVLQPILVRPQVEGRYVIIAGERRWRGAMAAGLENVPCVVRDLHPDDRAAVQLIENLAREDLTVWDMGRHIERMVTRIGGRGAQAKVASLIGKAAAVVSQYLALSSLPVPVANLEHDDRDYSPEMLVSLGELYDLDQAVADTLLSSPQSLTRGTVRSALKRVKGFQTGKEEMRAVPASPAAGEAAPETDPDQLSLTGVSPEPASPSRPAPAPRRAPGAVASPGVGDAVVADDGVVVDLPTGRAAQAAALPAALRVAVFPGDGSSRDGVLVVDRDAYSDSQAPNDVLILFDDDKRPVAVNCVLNTVSVTGWSL